MGRQSKSFAEKIGQGWSQLWGGKDAQASDPTLMAPASQSQASAPTTQPLGSPGAMDILGDLFAPSPASAHASAPLEGEVREISIRRNPQQQLTTSNMSPEELKARRIARVENAANIVESLHVRAMLKFLDGLCFIGPFWILFWTTSEVGQLFTGKPFDWADQTSWNVYAAALFGECILAGLTFVWQYADTYLQSLDENSPQRVSLKSWVTGLGWTWLVFAAISAYGQFKYLESIWSPHDVSKYILIVGRVLIYTAGEWACAKYLGWRITTLKKIAQEEKTRGEMYDLIAVQESNRMAKEAEADARLLNIKIQSHTTETNAQMTGKVQQIMSDSAVKFLGKFTDTVDTVMNDVLSNIGGQLQLPPNKDTKQLNSPRDDDER